MTDGHESQEDTASSCRASVGLFTAAFCEQCLLVLGRSHLSLGN